jgi:hypothetical protein
MQKQIIPSHLEWQSAPSENLVSSFPEKSRQKINKHSKIVNESILTIDQIFKEEISRYVYPDIRYSCPYCGTMDVLIKVSTSRWAIEIDCLDCKKISLAPVNGGDMSCLC